MAGSKFFGEKRINIQAKAQLKTLLLAQLANRKLEEYCDKTAGLN